MDIYPMDLESLTNFAENVKTQVITGLARHGEIDAEKVKDLDKGYTVVLMAKGLLERLAERLGLKMVTGEIRVLLVKL